MIWLQGDLFSDSYGVLDGSAIDFNSHQSRRINEMIIFIVAIMAALYFQKSINKQLPFILIIIALGQTSFISYNLFIEPTKKKISQTVEPEFYNYSSNKNIIYIILDTFGADYFEQIRELDPSVVDDFNGFVNYIDAISNYPATAASLSSVMTGQMIPENMQRNTFLKNIAAKNSLPHELDKKGYESSMVSIYRLRNIYTKRFLSGSHLAIQSVNRFYGLQLLDFSLFRISPQFFKSNIYNQGLWKFSKNYANQHNIPSSPSEKGAYMLNLMTENAQVSDNINRFKIIHVLLPHPEFVYNSQCEKIETLQSLEQAMLKQSQCAIKMLKQYMNKLKQLGIYDSSLIVVTSDHGSRIMTDMSIHGFPSYYELNTSGVLFMIKGINQKQNFEDIDTPVSLINLYDMLLNEDVHDQKIDFLFDDNRLFYSYKNNTPGAKKYLPDAPLFKVDKNYRDPKSWTLERLVTNKCPTESIPETFYITKSGREKYCAKFCFSIPEKDGSGAWTESDDIRMVFKLDLSKKPTPSDVDFSIHYKPLIIAAQNELQLSWYINDELIASQKMITLEKMITHFNLTVASVKQKELTELKIKIKNLTSMKKMGLSEETRKLGLFISSISID
ncbi:MAG: sulfatase-like hydrolase/transferase [Marinicellaceae bacterium]